MAKKCYHDKRAQVTSKAREVRNKLVHDGSHPDKFSTLELYSAVLALIKNIVNRDFPLASLDLGNHSLSDPFDPPGTEGPDVKYWMPFPKLPGEEDIEKEEAHKRACD